MGKGYKRSKRGKIHIGSFGRTRLRRKSTTASAGTATAKKADAKKAK